MEVLDAKGNDNSEEGQNKSAGSSGTDFIVETYWA